MIRKYHSHKPQIAPWHREEESLNHHETPGRQWGLGDLSASVSSLTRSVFTSGVSLDHRPWEGSVTITTSDPMLPCKPGNRLWVIK